MTMTMTAIKGDPTIVNPIRVERRGTLRAFPLLGFRIRLQDDALILIGANDAGGAVNC